MRKTALQQATEIIEQRRQKAIADNLTFLKNLNSHTDWQQADTDVRRLRVKLAQSDSQDIQKVRQQLAVALQHRHQILKKYNATENQLKPQYTCSLCNDTGYVNNTRCSCLKKVLTDILVKNCNINNIQCTFENSTEKDAHNKKVYALCKDICEKGSNAKLKNILLTGKTGTGKTYLLSAIANKYLQLDREVLFLTAYNLNNQFLKCHLADLDSKSEYLDNITDIDVLIIDDLGTENILRNVTIEYLFVVLNERIQNNKTTIVSTNLTLQQIQDRYEDRIFSRLADKSITLCAELKNVDKRILKPTVKN